MILKGKSDILQQNALYGFPAELDEKIKPSCQCSKYKATDRRLLPSNTVTTIIWCFTGSLCQTISLAGNRGFLTFGQSHENRFPLFLVFYAHINWTGSNSSYIFNVQTWECCQSSHLTLTLKHLRPSVFPPKTFKWFPLKMGKIHKNRAKLHNQIWYHTHNVVNVIRQINWQGAGVVFPSTSTCFATWRIWKQRGSQRKETVVVFDDLSWVCFICAGHGPQINSFVVLRSLGLRAAC